MDFRDVLAEQGLNEKEVATYTALLEIGEASVFSIAKKAGLKRPNTYVVLGALETKGLVSRILKYGKTFFIAQHPKKLISDTELKLKELSTVLPELENLIRHNDQRPRVTIYEGKSALDKAYDEYFVMKGEILFMSNMELVHEVFARTLQKLDYVSTSSEYVIRELGDDSPATEAYIKKAAGRYHQIRIMPKEFSPFATDIGIFGNITLITSGKKEFFTVKIESEEIANAFRALFEAMWQLSRALGPAPE